MVSQSQMRCIDKRGGYTEAGIRWAARITATPIAALLFLQAAGHLVNEDGLYNPFTEPVGVTLRIIGLFGTFAGAIIAWKWEGIGCVLVIAGLLPYNVSEDKAWFGGWVGLLQLAAVGFIACCCLRRLAAKVGGQSQSTGPRRKD
jgi:hypothetical protein